MRTDTVSLFIFTDLTFLRIIVSNDFIISPRLPLLKNVISENYFSDIRLKFFLFHGRDMLYSRDIQYFVYRNIPSTAKFVASWRVLAHERGYILQQVFLHHK